MLLDHATPASSSAPRRRSGQAHRICDRWPQNIYETIYETMYAKAY